MLELLIVLALVLLNGFFALSEMSVVTSRKARLKQQAETSRGARKALELFRVNYRWDRDRPIRSIGVRGADLVTTDGSQQLDLFERDAAVPLLRSG